MPVIVKKIFEKVKLKSSEPIKWGFQIPEISNGVYIISNSKVSNLSLNGNKKIEFDVRAIEQWKVINSKLELNKISNPSIKEIIKELTKRWHSNENIIYIGKASGKDGLQQRIKQLYQHKVGKSAPHAGGFWLKLLKNYEQLYIYYSKCENAENTEFQMLLYFVERLAGKPYYEIDDIGDFLPFANLKIDLCKNHNFDNMTVKRKKLII